MSGQVVSILPIPRETARSARTAFGHNNFYIQIGENLESILLDIQPSRLLKIGIILPQITLFQFLEGLTDIQVIDAVRTRLDWKFALHLPSYYPIFRETELCIFRQLVLNDDNYQHEIELLVARLIQFNHPEIDKFRNFNNPNLVKMVCSMNRLGLVHEAMNRAIEALVRKFPEWLRTIALPHWYGRYNHSVPSYKLASTLDQQEVAILGIVADIRYILEQVHLSGSDVISELEELSTLQEILASQTLITNQTIDKSSEFLCVNTCNLCIYRGWMIQNTNFS